MRIKIVYRYLIKTFIGPFILTFFLAMFILLMQFLWKYIDDVVGKGLDIPIIAEFIFYASASFVSMAMPLAVLLASLMTFGNLGERYEIVAMKSAGIPLSRLMMPLACFCFFIGVFSFWFANNIAPIANAKASARYYDIKTLKQAFKIDEGVFYDGIPNYIIRVGKKDKDGEGIHDIIIYDHSQRQGNTTMTYAQSGTMKMTPDDKYFLITLYDGYYWDESVNDNNPSSHYPLTRAKFKKQYQKFDLSSFQFQKTTDESFFTDRLLPTVSDLSHDIDTINMDIDTLKKNFTNDYFSNMYYFNMYLKNNDSVVLPPPVENYYSYKELSRDKQWEVFNYASQYVQINMNSIFFEHEHLNDRNNALRHNWIELYQKFTVALVCFLFFFIGAPLGSIIRKGGIGIPLVITVFFYTTHFALTLIGENIAKSGRIPVAFGMWLPIALLVPICIFLTYKATVDSAMLSPDTYEKLLKKLKLRKKT
ncbi:MAG: LptF/LptG family permease [Bacteroidales bacterium]|nr:LptF/LptG family permease [Bacteroidales bacterium]